MTLIVNWQIQYNYYPVIKTESEFEKKKISIIIYC